MSSKTHLNLIMVMHEDVGGMWKVFRVISHLILENRPAISIWILLHYFIGSSLLPLFISFFSTTMPDEQISLHLKAVQTHHHKLCTTNEFWHELNEAIGPWKKKRSHFNKFLKGERLSEPFQLNIFYFLSGLGFSGCWAELYLKTCRIFIRKGKKSPRNSICHIYTTLQKGFTHPHSTFLA